MDTHALLHVVYMEHKQRTGHDVKQGDFDAQALLSAQCDICMTLRLLWEQAEREYIEEQRAANTAAAHRNQ